MKEKGPSESPSKFKPGIDGNIKPEVDVEKPLESEAPQIDHILIDTQGGNSEIDFRQAGARQEELESQLLALEAQKSELEHFAKELESEKVCLARALKGSQEELKSAKQIAEQQRK